MEEKGDLFKRREVGSPTRLQKRAPASLDINKVLSVRPSNPFGEASKAIPLLSPLILSPQPLYAEIAVVQAIAASENNGNHLHSSSNVNEGRSLSSTPGSGWEHPAIASFPDPSSLCSFFQKQCVFVNHAQ